MTLVPLEIHFKYPFRIFQPCQVFWNCTYQLVKCLPEFSLPHSHDPIQRVTDHITTYHYLTPPSDPLLVISPCPFLCRTTLMYQTVEWKATAPLQPLNYPIKMTFNLSLGCLH